MTGMYIKLYFIALTVFLGIDAIWLTLIAKNFYAEKLGYLMSKSPNLLAALVFYLIFTAALVFFVINPALEKKDWINALLAGAFFGLTCYATYDLTNLATVKNWPLIITIIDLVWGTVLSATVSVATYFLARKFGI